MIIAGLVAKGTTSVEEIKHIQRGYEDIVGKLTKLGADIYLQQKPDSAADRIG